MTKVALETLGCKVNQAESELLWRGLAEAGHQVVSGDEEAAVYLVNTCTVTHVADSKSRHSLRKARSQNPEALVVAMGCYARRAPEALATLADVCLEGQGGVARLVEVLQQHGYPPGKTEGQSQKEGKPWRTRSLVKVQEGCSDGCTYCIVPRVRGQPRSLPLPQVMEEVRVRVASGYREFTLTGTKLGAYRDGDVELEGMVENVLTGTGAERIRLSSLQPQDITPGFLSLWRDDRLCRHFHLPLQSGSAAVLKRMGRGYSLEDFARAVRLIKDASPDAAITTDVMVGFPGESEEEFEESLRFCCQAEFARMHVFPFSPRPGTPAARMPGQVEGRTRMRRKLQMLGLAARSASAFRGKFLGQSMKVLWERGEGRVWTGLTGNYIRVFTTSCQDPGNRVLEATLVGEHERGMWGVLR